MVGTKHGRSVWKSKHYRCKKCGLIISFRSKHLEITHPDVADLSKLRGLEGKPELQDYFADWFTETDEPYSKINYAPSMKYL